MCYVPNFSLFLSFRTSESFGWGMMCVRGDGALYLVQNIKFTSFKTKAISCKIYLFKIKAIIF